VCPGVYTLGDIEVIQVYHWDGHLAGHDIWHVIVNGRLVEMRAYLRDAKKAAHKIDRDIRRASVPDGKEAS